jgi:hypothetical protein
LSDDDPSRWAPSGPASGDEGKEKQPLWSGGDPAPAEPAAADPAGDLGWPPPASPPPPPAFPDRGMLKTPPSATFSLLLGIAGLLVCPVICSIAAIALGNSAKARIDANPRYPGRGVAQAGVVLGIAGLAIWAVFFVIGIAGVLGIGGGV